ncbi:MAG: RecX family transcriptional regulator [Anaeromyxobacter sp.]
MPTDQTPLARAQAVVLRQLASRARTEAQLRARLAREDLSEVADQVMAWLRRLGYLDDAAYARARARALVAPGRLGPRAAERKLVAEGIGAAAARAAVQAALAGEDGQGGGRQEEALCRALAERRARGTPLSALDARGRARLGRFLAGRGFSGSIIARVLGIFEDGEA